MEQEYLFSRKFNKEEYRFYRKSIYTKQGQVTYFEVVTPENCLGYPDYILFAHGIPYSQWRYCPQWILKACKMALIKKGYQP